MMSGHLTGNPAGQALSRRSFIKTAAIAATATTIPAILAACGGGSSARGKVSVAVLTWASIPSSQGTFTNNAMTRWIKQKAPVDVNFVSIGNYTDQYSTMIAAGNAPDLMWCYWQDWKNKIIAKNGFRKLEDLIDQNCPNYQQLLSKYPGLKKASIGWDGHIYQFGKVQQLQPNHALLIRTDWLKKLGLATPETSDDLITVAKAFQQHMPELGGANGHGMTMGYNNTMQIVDAIFQNYPLFVENGQLKVNGWDRMQAALEFRKQLYEAGAISRDFLSDKDGSLSSTAWNSGKVGIYGGGAGIGNDWLSGYKDWKKNNPGGTYTAIPLPKTPFGQFSPAIIPPFQILLVMNAHAKDPAAAAQYADFLYSKDAQHVLAESGGTSSKKDATGCVVSDPNLSYSWVYNMTAPTGEAGTACASPIRTFDATADADAKELLAIYNDAANAYLTPDRPWPQFTWVEYIPAMPPDLQLNFTTLLNSDQNAPGQIPQIVLNAIVDKNTSAAQAIDHAKQVWNSSGGPQIDEWWGNWYAKYKDKFFLTKDLYTAGTGVAGH